MNIERDTQGSQGMGLQTLMKRRDVAVALGLMLISATILFVALSNLTYVDHDDFVNKDEYYSLEKDNGQDASSVVKNIGAILSVPPTLAPTSLLQDIESHSS
jgi:hypothetical protein